MPGCGPAADLPLFPLLDANVQKVKVGAIPAPMDIGKSETAHAQRGTCDTGSEGGQSSSKFIESLPNLP